MRTRPTPARLAHAVRPVRPTHRARLAPLALAATAVLAVGCSGSDEPEPTPTPTASDSPLEALLEEYLGDWSNEQVNAQLVRMEELVAECMAEQGFDYTPVDYTAMDLDLTGEGLDAEWGTAEFAQEYGYGLTTNPVLGDETAPEDPNAEYVAAMSASEQDAYYRALYGDEYETLSTDPEAAATTSWEDLGCTGAAQNEMLGVAGEEDEFTALQEEMATMMASADADPRLNQANADWAACMAGRDHPGLTAVGDAEAEITAELTRLQQEAYAAATDPTTGVVDEAAAQAALAAPLAELGEREVVTAVDDAECRVESGYDDVRAEVDAEYQAEFLAEHRTELLQWLDSLNELRED